MMVSRLEERLQTAASQLKSQFQAVDKFLQNRVDGNLYQVLPEDERPTAKISHIKLTADDVRIENLRAAIHGRPDRACPPGTYVRLHVKGWAVDPIDTQSGHWRLMMSDTPYELLSGRELRQEAHGNVLILGLGLGATTIPVLQKNEVLSVTVVENNKDVIDLVTPHLQDLKGGEKLTVYHGDANTWRPPKGALYNTIWIDIWPNVSADNLSELLRLKRKYSRKLDRKNDPDVWIGAWEEKYLRSQVRHGR